MIQLIKSGDGRLILASNQPFPSDIAHVEYYRDLKLMMLTFEGEDDGDMLMPSEISDDVAKVVTASPDVIVVTMEGQGSEPYGYITPLIQIGL